MLIIFEGYEFTGKSHTMKQYKKVNSMYSKYEPSDNTQWVPYSDRYALGVPLLELSRMSVIDQVLLVSRGLPSSIVYNKLYEQNIKVLESEEFLTYAREMYRNPKIVTTNYMYHESKSDAQYLYEMAKYRKGNESYDKFSSFDSYYENYQKFHEAYLEVLEDICKGNYSMIRSISQ